MMMDRKNGMIGDFEAFLSQLGTVTENGKLPYIAPQLCNASS